MMWFMRDKDLYILQHLRYIEFQLICLHCIFILFLFSVSQYCTVLLLLFRMLLITGQLTNNFVIIIFIF